jgi:hypothetical protein
LLTAALHGCGSQWFDKDFLIRLPATCSYNGCMYLFRLHKLARQLLPLRMWSLLLALAGVSLIVFALLGTEDQNSSLLRIAIVMTLWALLVFAFIQLFQTIPAPVLPKDRFIERLRSHVKLALYQVLALAVVIIGVMLISISLKLLLL